MASVSFTENKCISATCVQESPKISEPAEPAEPTPKLKKALELKKAPELKKATMEDLFGIGANGMNKKNTDSSKNNNYIPSNRLQEEFGPKKRIKP